MGGDNAPKSYLSRGEVAQRLGISISAVRWHEKHGNVKCIEGPRGMHLFTEGAVQEFEVWYKTNGKSRAAWELEHRKGLQDATGLQSSSVLEPQESTKTEAPLPVEVPPLFPPPPVSKPPRDYSVIDDEAVLREENRQLLSEVTKLRKTALTEERVRRELFKLVEEGSLHPPQWLTGQVSAVDGAYGVPTLFLSDFHLGEVVDAGAIGGVNSYNTEIAKSRWRRITDRAISLCWGNLQKPQFDGVVLALGGDIISGTIHEELVTTNEIASGPAVLEAAELVIWSVGELKKAFKKVFVPCVIGNHGRTTKKLPMKEAAVTSYDWIVYNMAARAFRGDPDVSFHIPSGFDARWNVYGHKYSMTHGAQFKGGDGFIGPWGSVFRGDARRRARDTETENSYQTLLVAHFHNLRMDSRIIMNGSIVGYSEFAAFLGLPFEPPKQGLWVTHPRFGITFSFPVLAEDPTVKEPGAWVTV